MVHELLRVAGHLFLEWQFWVWMITAGVVGALLEKFSEITGGWAALPQAFVLSLCLIAAAILKLDAGVWWLLLGVFSLNWWWSPTSPPHVLTVSPYLTPRLKLSILGVALLAVVIRVLR